MMSTCIYRPRPHQAIPPGKILDLELHARGWTLSMLSKVAGIPLQELTEIREGRKEISPGIAESLAEAFGTSSELWVSLEAGYRAALRLSTLL